MRARKQSSEDLFGFAPGPDEDSGIHSIPDIKEAMKGSRQEYADVIENIQNTPALKPFLSNQKHQGELSGVITRLHKFYDWVFAEDGNYLNSEEIKNQLTDNFEKAMNSVIKRWPKLAAAGADWTLLCEGINTSFIEMGRVFGLENEMQGFVTHWFDLYRRNQLNAQALGAHRELSYYRATGGDDKQVVKTVRDRIGVIEEELGQLPIHEENYPAFSYDNPEHPSKKRMLHQADLSNMASPRKPKDAAAIKGELPEKFVTNWERLNSSKTKTPRHGRKGSLEKPRKETQPKKKPWWKFW